MCKQGRGGNTHTHPTHTLPEFVHSFPRNRSEIPQYHPGFFFGGGVRGKKKKERERTSRNVLGFARSARLWTETSLNLLRSPFLPAKLVCSFPQKTLPPPPPPNLYNLSFPRGKRERERRSPRCSRKPVPRVTRGPTRTCLRVQKLSKAFHTFKEQPEADGAWEIPSSRKDGCAGHGHRTISFSTLKVSRLRGREVRGSES